MFSCPNSCRCSAIIASITALKAGIAASTATAAASIIIEFPVNEVVEVIKEWAAWISKKLNLKY